MNPVQDDFSQYEVQPLVDDFAKYEVTAPEESTLGSIVRGGARVASRVGESLIGLPGDIRELVGTGAIKAAEFVTGKEQPGLRRRLEEHRQAPLSSQLREKTKELFGGYTEPLTAGEEKSDEFLTDLAMLALPVKGKIPFVRALGADVAGHLVKEGAEKLGAGETAQDLSKIGTFLIAGLITPGKTAGTFANNLYKERDAILPVGADVDASLLRGNLERLKKHLEKGVPGAKENAVLDPIEKLLQKTAGGRIEVSELTTAKRQINDKVREVIAKEGVKPKDAKQLFKSLGRNIEDTIELYGKQSNPAFLKLHKDANQAFGALEESKKITNFIRDKVPGSSKLAASVLFEAATLGVPAAIKTVGAAAVGYSAAKGMELMLRINNSPVLRKYYLGVVKNSVSGNSAAAAKNLQALDMMIKKEDPDMHDDLSRFLVG